MTKSSMLLSLVAALAVSCSSAFAGNETVPANFLYAGSGELEGLRTTFKRPDIDGAQVVYTWKSLEPAFGQYDFSAIERDLALADSLGKKLFIQIQDRFFSPEARRVPEYLLREPQYGGGLAPQVDNPGEGEPAGHGWVAMQWNPAVRDRFQALLKALAEAFDGKVFGVNLPETAADIEMANDRSGFECDAYFQAEMENAAAARTAFTKSHVVQYVNFWPCEWENDRNYMGRIFDYASKHEVGLGGPDIVPHRKEHMKNAYPFFHEYNDRLDLVAMAVQEPTLTYTNPKTGKTFTKDELVRFASEYLGVGVIFWSAASPWLKE